MKKVVFFFLFFLLLLLLLLLILLRRKTSFNIYNINVWCIVKYKALSLVNSDSLKTFIPDLGFSPRPFMTLLSSTFNDDTPLTFTVTLLRSTSVCIGDDFS